VSGQRDSVLTTDHDIVNWNVQQESSYNVGQISDPWIAVEAGGLSQHHSAPHRP